MTRPSTLEKKLQKEYRRLSYSEKKGEKKDRKGWIIGGGVTVAVGLLAAYAIFSKPENPLDPGSVQEPEQQAQVVEAPTDTEIPTYTAVPTKNSTQTPVPTQRPTRVVKRWDRSWIADSYSQQVELEPGELLYVSASQFRSDTASCNFPDGGGQICVYIKESSGYETVNLSNLTPNNAWIAISEKYTLDEALEDRTSALWQAPNCGAGCDYARVLMERADGNIDEFALYPNGTTQDLN